MSITLWKPQWNGVEKRGLELVISLSLLARAFASFISVSGGTSSSVKPWYKSLKVMAIASHMLSSSSTAVLALPWGIDESGLESDGVSVTAGPGSGRIWEDRQNWVKRKKNIDLDLLGWCYRVSVYGIDRCGGLGGGLCRMYERKFGCY